MENTSTTVSASCIFCKIVRGEIPTTVVCEDGETLAFLDIRPKAPGHTLIIPKQHSRNLLDAEITALTAVAGTTQVVGRAVMQALGADGLNIISNNEPAAGQDVFHYHVHIIPRYVHGDPDHSADEIAARIRKALT